jgi:hypothetical protein
MKLLATSLVLALLVFTNLSASQQTAIITELAAYSSLAPCAASAVSSAAIQFSNLWCSPTTSPAALASCICLTALSSAAVSDEISGAAEGLCTGSSDLKFALSVLTTYCDAASQGNASPALPTTKPTPEGTITETSNAVSSTSSTAAGSTSTNTGISSPASTSVSNPSSVSPSNSSSSPLQTGSGGGLSESDKIAIGKILHR